MLFQCLFQVFWLGNLTTVASPIPHESTQNVSQFLVSVYADFQYKSIAHKIIAIYSDLTELRSEKCASTRRASAHQKSPILAKKTGRALSSANGCNYSVVASSPLTPDNCHPTDCAVNRMTRMGMGHSAQYQNCMFLSYFHWMSLTTLISSNNPNDKFYH